MRADFLHEPPFFNKNYFRITLETIVMLKGISDLYTFVNPLALKLPMIDLPEENLNNTILILHLWLACKIYQSDFSQFQL